MSFFEILGSVGGVVVFLYTVWYFLFTDCDIVLAFSEKFGRPIESFKGKVVWITGASTGLGEAMAYELASVGAKLILSARSRDLLEDVKEVCLERSKGKLEKKDILVLSFDISDTSVHQTHVENAINQFGKIDLLVNNAARYQIGSIVQTHSDVARELFDINFFGGINLTKLILNHFLETGKGHFVVVSSIAGKLGIPSTASYVATKHALQGYFETLRMEYNNDKIGVTMVYPGIFKSSMFSKTMSSTKGEIFQKEESNEYECNKMTSERCAQLTLVAAANKLFEGWIAYQPFLFMLWASQYCPGAFKYFMLKIYSRKRIQSLNEGKWPSDLPVWKPLFRR